MFADQYLHLASLFLSYFVKVAVAYLVCFFLSKMFIRPAQQFAVWMVFMMGAGGYWLLLLWRGMSAAFVNSGVPGTGLTAGNPLSAFQHVTVGASWERPVSIFGRAAILTYVAGLALLVSVALWKRVRLHMLLRRGCEASLPLQLLFSELCRHAGITNCELLVLGGLHSPATVYWWRPRILLPKVCEQLDTAEVADVLYHELAHIVRRDYLWASLNELICGMLFFHPAVWQARKHMRLQRELACDLQVVSSRPDHRADYAGTLTQFARLCQPAQRSSLKMDFASSASVLSRRVHAILSEEPESSWLQQMFRGASFVVLLGSYLLVAPALGIVLELPHLQQSSENTELHAPAAPVHAAGRSVTKKPFRAIPQEDAAPRLSAFKAYRMQSVPGQPLTSYNPAAAASGASSYGTSAGLDSRSGGWNESAPGRATTTSKVSIISVIAGAVGAVAGGDNDKDERTASRRKVTH
jgi:beta-lactamase regulating signal transducer with metallopeptidase domain